MGALDVVWSLCLDHLGASKTFISLTWVAFSVPMLLSVRRRHAGGPLQPLLAVHRRLRALGLAWIFYGMTTNLTPLLIVNVLEGLAIAFSYPAKQAFLIQVSPRAGSAR